MTSQPGKKIIAIHVLLNISRSKDNQTTKFDQLLEYDMRNIFLEKSFAKCGEETIPRPFSKKSILSISPDQQLKVLYSLFSLYARFRFGSASYKAFLKNKKSHGLVFLPHILHGFWRKISPFCILLTDQIPLSGSFYFVRYWAIWVSQLFVNLFKTS